MEDWKSFQRRAYCCSGEVSPPIGQSEGAISTPMVEPYRHHVVAAPVGRSSHFAVYSWIIVKSSFNRVSFLLFGRSCFSCRAGQEATIFLILYRCTIVFIFSNLLVSCYHVRLVFTDFLVFIATEFRSSFIENPLETFTGSRKSKKEIKIHNRINNVTSLSLRRKYK